MLLANSLSTTITRDAASLRALSREWTRLWEKCGNATPFQRPEWLVPWTEALKPRQLNVVELRRNSDLVGLAPMFAYHWDGQSILAPLGAGITDYLDWLIMPEFAREGIVEILWALNDSSSEWDRIDLPDLPGWSALLNYCDYVSFHRVSQEVCPAIELPGEGASRKTAIPDRQRKNLRTACNRIRKAGDARIEIADSVSLPEFQDALFRLHNSRWHAFGMPGVLSELAIQEFHWRSTPELLRAGILRFYGLRFRGELIAVLHTLWGCDSVSCYLQGFDPDYAFFSPGMQIIARVLEDATRESKMTLDFLRGSEAYKYAWGARDRFTSRLQLRRADLAQQLDQMRAA